MKTGLNAIFITLILTLIYSPSSAEVNGLVSPEEEERIIAEEIAAGRMTEIIPSKNRSSVQLPAGFDRSADIAFPPIGSQRGGSCTGWSTTYYQATYQVAKREGWDAKNGGEEFWCSPHWTYNFINNGGDNGGSMTNNNEVLIRHGAATWADFPEGDPNRATSWSTDPAVWRKAIKHRMKSKSSLSNVDTPEGLQTLKEHIYNPVYGITFATNSPSSGEHWVWTDIKDDPSTPDDDAFVGEVACYYVLSNRGGSHALAVIGWNDHIWIDVNQNGSVDTGEKGALKISESHGTSRGNDGFYWLAYDALHDESQIPGGPTTDRSPAFSSRRATVVEHRTEYDPKLFAEFTLQTAARIDVVIEFLRADVTATEPFSNPEDSWQGYVFGTMRNADSNRLGFDGEDYSSNPSDAPEGTFVFDLTDIIPTNDQGETWRYVMQVQDRTAGMPVTVSDFKVIIPGANGDTEFTAQNTPITVDDATDYVWVDVPTITEIISPEPKDAVSAVSVKRTARGVLFTIAPSVVRGDFNLQVFDVSGKKIWSYSANNSLQKAHSVQWNFSNDNRIQLGNGIYLAVLSTATKQVSQKFTLLQ